MDHPTTQHSFRTITRPTALPFRVDNLRQLQLAVQSGPQAAAGGLFALVASLWCFGLVLFVGQFVLFIIALIQILSRDMPTDAKLLWAAVSIFVPIIGPILWWTIGSKQNPPPRPGA